MQKILAILLSILMISSFSTVYAQESEPIILEQLSPSGQVLVKLEWPEVYPLDISTINVSFHDGTTGELLDNLRLNYNLTVTQHDIPVEIYKHNLSTDGTGHFVVMFPEESQGLAKVIVELRIANDKAGNMYTYEEEVEFSVNVVPEFGLIVMIILSAAFVPILLISKTRLVSKF